MLERSRRFIDTHPILFVFLVALMARVVVAVFMARYFSGSFVLDDRTYWDMARDLATGNTDGWTDYLHSLYASTVAFTFPLSLIYGISGGAELAGQMFVVLLGAGTAAAVTLLAKDALSTGLAVFVGLVIALLPSQALWSSLILKDAAVWLTLVALAVLIALAARSSGKRVILLAAAVFLALVALAYLRQHTLVVACWALMLSGWVGQRALRYQRLAGAVIIGITVPWITGYGPAGLAYVASAGSIEERRAANAENADSAFAPGRRDTAVSILEQSQVEAAEIAEKKTQLAERATKVREDLRGRTPSKEERARQERRLALIAERLDQLEAERAAAERKEREAALELARIRGAEREPGITHLARGVSVMLAEPYPWDAGTSPSFRMAQAETVVWYPILILALLGLPAAVRVPRVTLFPLLAGGALMLVYALVEGNVGTAYRHRGEFVWVIALLAGFGVLQVRRLFKTKESSRAGED